MKLTLFSVEEANRLAADIRPALARLVHAQRELDRLQGRIDVLTLASSGSTPRNPDAQELERLREKRDRLVERVRLGVEVIHGRGAVVKDLARGLVDFYSIAGDRLIFLCWEIGEAEVTHWHSLEGGYASRQPLNRTGRD